MRAGRALLLAHDVLIAAALALALVGVVASAAATDTPQRRQTLAPHTWAWVWPQPDRSGRMALGPLPTFAPGAAAPRLTAEDAVKAASRADLGPPPGLAPGDVRVTLRRIGSPTGPIAWVIEYARDPMLLGGPPGLSREARQAILSAGVCERVVVVDAARGTLTTMVQACWPRGANLVGGYAG